MTLLSTAHNPLATAAVDVVTSLTRLGHLFYVSLVNESRERGFVLSIKRVLVLGSLLIVLPLLCVWNHVGFFLDDLLFPSWRKTQVKSPVFLVGNARSGTTWLHRLLTKADGAFTTFRTWEILVAVPVVWKCLFYFLYLWDKTLCFGLYFKALSFVERSLLGDIVIHPLGLQECEEDEWLMMHVGMSQLLLFFFPAASASLNSVVLFDCPRNFMEGDDLRKEVQDIAIECRRPNGDLMSNQLPTESPSKSPGKKMRDMEEPQLSLPLRLSIMHFYKQCVQRHMYFRTQILQRAQSWASDPLCVHPTPCVFVSKNPAFTLRIETLYNVFPDAHVLCVLRDPVKSIPSMVSYIAQVWHTVASPVLCYPNVHHLLSFCKAHYLFPLLHLHYHNLRANAALDGPAVHGSPQFVLHPGRFVSYHHLRRNLGDGVKRLLLHLLADVRGAVVNAIPMESLDTELRRLCPWVNLDRMNEYLEQAQLETAHYVSEHCYDYKQCCGGMTVEELKGSLDVIYQAHYGAFDG